jgi:hypothetical protein
MDAGRRFYRTGLLNMKTLFLLLTFFLLIFTYADAQENGPVVSAIISPDSPVRGGTFTITLIIDHPAADEVNVISHPFTDSVTLDRFLRTPGITDRYQTFVEYRFIVNNSGSITLGPFTVITPAGVTETGIFTINVPAAGNERLSPRMTWIDPPAQAAIGQRVTLTLRVNGWNSQQPPPSFFMPQVPRGVILSPAPISPQERTSGIIMRLTLIPLEEGTIVLPARSLQHENTFFEIPALQLRIIPR